MGLLGDVLEVPDEGGLGHIGDVVGRQDLGEVLLLLGLAGDDAARRGRGGVREMGGGGGALEAGIHVGLVVVADVDHVVAPLHGAGMLRHKGAVAPVDADQPPEHQGLDGLPHGGAAHIKELRQLHLIGQLLAGGELPLHQDHVRESVRDLLKKGLSRTHRHLPALPAAARLVVVAPA